MFPYVFGVRIGAVPIAVCGLLPNFSFAFDEFAVAHHVGASALDSLPSDVSVQVDRDLTVHLVFELAADLCESLCLLVKAGFDLFVDFPINILDVFEHLRFA